MHGKFDTFIFESWEWNPLAKKLFLRYSLDGEINFEEVWKFDFEFAKNQNQQPLRAAMKFLWIVAGVSYFKSVLPQNIVFAEGDVNKAQAKFFEKLWTQGLGEFFWQNKIDPRRVVRFPVNETVKSAPERVKKLNGTMLPIGGGKDSLLSAEILRAGEEAFVTWTVGDSLVQTECCKKLDAPRLKVSRKIAPELLELNKAGALNGHVPISSILAFGSVVTALLSGQKSIVLSNEHSANSENLEFHGQKINHQYSKSLEFEQDFQTFVAENITPDVEYFSLLRPLSELRIAEIFAEKCWDEWASVFSSCNRNFHLAGSKLGEKRWCGQCAKCAFVGLLFAAFLSPEKWKSVWGDPEIFVKQNRADLEALLGLKNHKPFECVGEIEESQTAVHLAAEKFSAFKPLAERVPKPKLDWKKWHPHAMPKKFETLLLSFCSS
ncbi:MAG: endonuclease domain-containing protein [Candidatus Gracilibacteria bacterium]|nr:endonuclease domain-containing protein [Candidatus Gracilibacteria bacterium]